MEKGLMIDVGRKFWSLEDLRKLILLLKKEKLTHLQLHLSDSSGFRLKSEMYPEITSKECYIKEEMLDFLAFAKEQNITIIPDIDSPGHLGVVLKEHPEFILKYIDEKGNEQPAKDALDVSNPEAVAFIKNIYREFIAVFSGCSTWHIGGDEFIDFQTIEQYPSLIQRSKEIFGQKATGLEFYVSYVNELTSLMKEQGITCRIWNDGFFRKDHVSIVELTKDVEVCYWTNWDKNMASIRFWLKKGYNIINFDDNDLYYVLGEKAGYTYPTLEHFKYNKFSGNQFLTEEEMKQVKGTFMSVWCDDFAAKTTTEIMADLAILLPKFVTELEKGQE
ncbi:lacto-N-biosidase [Enterococcus hirae]|nr:lacto-N-biosidase [Enterococcus hirae]